jgi:4-amino-4-deoxy-L-arabinose transferase-like glycosyltransferase
MGAEDGNRADRWSRAGKSIPAPSLRFAFILLVLAFLLRLGAVLAVRDIHQFHGPGPAGADAVDFNADALNLVSRHEFAVNPGHPTAFRAPGFPFLLAAIYSVFPAGYMVVYLCLCFCGAATCVLTWLASRELVNERVARAAGILLGVYFPHIYQSTVFLSEVLFGLLTVLGLWMILIYWRTGYLRWMAAAGVVFGYDALVRPVAVITAVFIVLCLLLIGNRQRFWVSTVLPIVCFGLAACAMVLPWTWRNYELFHKPVLIATNGGAAFHGGNNDVVLTNPKYKGLWITSVELPGRDLIEATPDEVAHDQVELMLGEQWAMTHWKQLPVLEFYKLARFFLPDTSSTNRIFVALGTLCYVPVLVLMAAALFRAGRKFWTNGDWRIVHALVLGNVVNALIFSGLPRYREAIAPILLMYAATGLSTLSAWSGGEEPVKRLSTRA